MKAVKSKFDIYIGYFLYFFCLKNRHMFGPGFTVSQMLCDKHPFFPKLPLLRCSNQKFHKISIL